MKAKNKTLILGLGNDILTDDGIGPKLVHDLSQRFNNQEYRFESACCGGLEIIEYIKGYKRVIFIDAIRTTGEKPGNVYYLTPSDFRETSHLSNLHDISFLTSLKLAGTLEIDLPSDLHIIAVEIVEDREFSKEFMPQVKERYPAILEEVCGLVRKISGL